MSEQIHVGDQYRTNDLSLKPGGYEVTVKYVGEKPRVYDKVKNPDAYIRSIQRQGKQIESVLVDGQPFHFER